MSKTDKNTINSAIVHGVFRASEEVKAALGDRVRVIGGKTHEKAAHAR